MKLTKKVITIILTVILLLLALSLYSYAGLTEEQREIIVNYAKNISYATNKDTGNYGIIYYADKTNGNNLGAYNNYAGIDNTVISLEMTTTEAAGTALYCDCTGFVGLIYHRGCTVNGKPFMSNRGYLNGNENNINGIGIGCNNFANIGRINNISDDIELLPGDVLLMYKKSEGKNILKKHTMLYTGTKKTIGEIKSSETIGEITHVTSGNNLGDKTAIFGGIYTENYEDRYKYYYNYGDLIILKPKDSVNVELTAEAIDVANNGFDWNKYVTGGPLNVKGVDHKKGNSTPINYANIFTESKTSNSGIMYDIIRSKKDGIYSIKNDYEYKGTVSGVFGAKSYNLDWLINLLKEILDWFIGINTYIIKMVIIGWGSLIEKIIADTFNNITRKRYNY